MIDDVKPLMREIGAGLILRRSSSKDADALAAFCGQIHGENPDQPDPRVAAWTYDLLAHPHPTFHPDDFTLVEEPATGRIISAMNLISQKWSYEGIEFGVGRPELVGTLPEFRNRGLVRRQFEEIHKWSAERGEQVQAITGIPFYYRLFGYEMALDLDGMRSGFEIHVPRLNAGEKEPYLIRLAGAADVPFLADVYRKSTGRYPLACIRDEAIWRYDLVARSPIVRPVFLIVEDEDHEPLGILSYDSQLGKYGIVVSFYELKSGVSWLDVTPTIIRHLWQTGQEYSQNQGRACTSFTFALGETHPVYDAFQERLPMIRKSYAWYLRVPDMAGFLVHIAPALEKRLAGSIACGYSGEKRISFYRSGLRMVFQRGRLAGVEPWMPKVKEQEGDIGFPYLTFLQLLFGYRSLQELGRSFPDCRWGTNETRALFESLFPKQPSQVYPVF